MHQPTAGAFLKNFQKEHPYLRTLGDFDGVPDEPDFTIDQRFIPFVGPAYAATLPINSALLG